MADNYVLSFDTQIDTANIEKQVKALSATLEKTTTTKITIDGEEATQQLRKYTTVLGDVLTRSTQISKSGEVISDVFTSITKSSKTASEMIKAVNQAFSNGTEGVARWKNSLGEVKTQFSTLSEEGERLTTRLTSTSDEYGNITTKIKEYNTANKQVGETQEVVSTAFTTTTTTTKELVNGYEALKTSVEQVDSAGNKLTTETVEYTNSAGELVTVITKLDSEGNQLGDRIVNVTNNMTELGEVTKTVIDKNTKLVDGIEETKTVTQEFYSNGEKITTTITEWVDAEGKLHTQTQKLNSANKEVSATTETITNDFAKVNNVTSTLVTKTTELTDGLRVTKTVTEQLYQDGERITTVLTQWTDAEGQLHTKTQQLNSAGKEVATTTENITKDMTQAGEVVNTLISRNTELVNGLEKTITTTETETADGEKLKTVVTEYTDELGRAVTQTQKFDSAGNQIGNTVTTMKQGFNEATEEVNNLQKALTKIADYYVASLPFRALNTVLQEGIEIIKEYDSAVTELKKVWDDSYGSLEDLSEKLSEIGLETANTLTNMTEVATDIVKAGYDNEEDIAVLSEYVAKLQNTADETLTASEATSILISQLKAYGYEAEQAVEITDVLNAVSAQQAVSSGDLSKALNVSSSSLATFNNSYEETVALITAGTTIMQGRSQMVGRGLTTIATRISKNEELLNSYGVALYDSEGQLRSTMDVLEDLSVVWNTLSDAEQIELGNTLAGTTRYAVFSAVMSEMSTATEAYEQALNSAGATEQQNEVYMDSLEAKTTQLKTAFESLVLSEDGILVKFAKVLVDIGTTALELADSTFVKLTLALTAMYEASKIIVPLWSTLSNSMLANFFGTLALEIASGTTAVELFTVAWNASPFIVLSAIALGVVAVAEAIDYFTTSLDEAHEALEETAQAYEDAQSTVSSLEEENTSLENQITLLEERRKELEETEGTTQEQLQAIDDENASLTEKLTLLEQELEYQNQILEAEKQKTKASALETYNSTGSVSIDSDSISALDIDDIVEDAYGYDTEIELAFRFTGNDEEILQEIGQAYQDAQTLIDELQSQYDSAVADGNTELATTLRSQITQIETYQAELITASQTSYEAIQTMQSAFADDEEYSGIFDELTTAVEDFLNITNQATEEATTDAEIIQQTLESAEAEYGVTAEAIEEYIEQNELLGDITEEDEDYLETYTEAIAEAGEALQQTTTDASEAVEGLQSLSDELQSLVDEYNNLSDAVADFNDGNGISLDSLDAILNAVTEYNGLLEYSNGQMSINESVLEELANARIQEAKAQVLQNTYAEMAEVIQEALSEAETSVASASTTQASADDVLATALSEVATEGFNAAEAMNAFMASLTGDNTLSDETQSKLNAIKEEALASLDAIDSVGSQITTSFSSFASTASSASSSASSAVTDPFEQARKELDYLFETGQISAEEYYERLYELGKKYYENNSAYAEEWYDLQVEVYEGLLSLLEDMIDEQIDQFEDAIDALEEMKDKAVEALEAERDAQLDAIEAQISALEKQRDAEEEYWDAKIDALKEQHEELEEQNKLMEYQEALAEAQAKRVMVMGEDGQWTYTQDEDAVSEAEQNLYDYELELAYEHELEVLEESKEEALAIIDQKIENLENYQEWLEDYYESQIEATEAYYDQQIALAEENLANYKAQSEALLAEMSSTANQENSIWQQRLANLASFVSAYNATLAQLGQTGVSSSSIVSVISKLSSSKVSSHASGVATIKDDEVAIVGEDPNKEIVLGSKINNGVPMQLSAGTGVVNASSTSTLAGILNQLGSNPFATGSQVYDSNTVNNNKSNTITISNVNLPSVSNGEEFINYLQNFNVDMISKSYTRS